MAAWVLVFASSSFASETAGKLPRKPALRAGNRAGRPRHSRRDRQARFALRPRTVKAARWCSGPAATRQTRWTGRRRPSREPLSRRDPGRHGGPFQVPRPAHRPGARRRHRYAGRGDAANHLRFRQWKARDGAAALQAGRLRPAEKATPILTAPMSRPTTTPSCRPTLPSGCQRSAIPTRFADHLKPAFKGKCWRLTYPHDDDARCTSTTSSETALPAVFRAPWRRRSRPSCAARRRRRPRWAPTPSVRWAT